METPESPLIPNPRSSSSKKNPTEKKSKIVIVMGATGAGKSRLAIDLASHFPIEIINADSMQVYKGLDVLTNKVPFHDQKGVPHHLLGTVSPNVEFTSKNFRDSAIQIIEEILSRDRLPVIVGGTNYYIQALVSPFLLDDSVDHSDECWLNASLGNELPDDRPELDGTGFNLRYDRLKEIDPDAANRIHPNDFRKINLYLSLYARTGSVPSKLFQGKAAEKWGRTNDFRYDCCFLCVDASLPVLDQYVEQRVDSMINSGLLDEVCDIYCLNADYTRGLRQAIGVREFEDLLRYYFSNTTTCYHPLSDRDFGSNACSNLPPSVQESSRENLKVILNNHSDSHCKVLLNEAVNKLKVNTKRLVRRQRRRLNRLQSFFGWSLHYLDATESLSGNFNDSWPRQVVEPAIDIIKTFLNDDLISELDPESVDAMDAQQIDTRDLWKQYVCKACGNRILRGAHEWEQHRQGRGHRKRMARLKKSQQNSTSLDGTKPYQQVNFKWLNC